MGLGQQLAMLVGALCLGVAATLGLVFGLASRYSSEGEGCLGKGLVFFALSLAGYFFYLGLAG